MIITIVAFNLKQKNSVYYGNTDIPERAAKKIQALLENDDVDFLSIRKIKED